MRRPSPSLLVLLLLVTALLLMPGLARAHHNPGHGPSEGLRALNTLGANPLPRQRVALVEQVSRSTDEPSLNTGTIYSTTAIVTGRLLPRLFVGAQFPFVIVDEDSVDEDSASHPEIGYGDTTADVQVAVGSLKKENAASYVLSLSLTMPTRTFRLEADPGKQWTVAPGFRYADAYKNLRWYAFLLAPTETRPAGTAIDVSPGIGIGYALIPSFTVTLGSHADIRALNVCTTVDGSDVCPEGRATETNRAAGTTRAYGSLSAALDLSKSWTLFGGGQMPFTKSRDIEWSVSLGAEFRF